jgi:hypothetical protein
MRKVHVVTLRLHHTSKASQLVNVDLIFEMAIGKQGYHRRKQTILMHLLDRPKPSVSAQMFSTNASPARSYTKQDRRDFQLQSDYSLELSNLCVVSSVLHATAPLDLAVLEDPLATIFCKTKLVKAHAWLCGGPINRLMIGSVQITTRTGWRIQNDKVMTYG